jgi:Uma2 family endonuclease
MTAKPLHKFSPEEYLAFERQSLERHEYLDGDIYAMVGASKQHLKIQANIAAYLLPKLESLDCWIFTNDARIRPQTSKAYFYPDLVIQCEEESYEDEFEDSILNPTIIIEILSPSTKNFDRGEKFVRYQTIPSLQSYVLVSQDSPLIERFDREGKTWVYHRTEGLDAVVEMAAVQCTLPLADVYRRITFNQSSDQA